MKVSDYIVKFFEEKGIYDFFGFQGTMIAHLVDSIGKNQKVVNHSVYNEQAAAFAACGFAKSSGKCAVAYATSGPGALNLVSGIADAYYDSAPVIFITGQVNTNEYTQISELRQQAFQQTDVISIVKPITKYAVFIESPNQIADELNKAWEIANSGRQGPVLLDIPMNVQRSEFEFELERPEKHELTYVCGDADVEMLLREISLAKRPVLLVGNGIAKDSYHRKNIEQLIHKYKIPVITTLLGSDLLSYSDEFNFGVIGSAYGHRYANRIVYEKADLIISLGASLCRRQTGMKSQEFAKNAKIIRIDIDKWELSRKVHDDEICIIVDVNNVVEKMLERTPTKDFSEWVDVCKKIKYALAEFDNNCEERLPNGVIEKIAEQVGEDDIIVCDVGQHMMWSMQSFRVKKNRMLYSGGHGAMGFALPAAIGAYYGCNKKRNIVCIAGDGAFQMNIQELQLIAREQIPICIIVLNNNALGLIRQQQSDFFEEKYFGATEEGGYTSPNFSDIANAYGIKGYRIYEYGDIERYMFWNKEKMPILLEIMLPSDTKAIPKTYFGQSMINQKPYISQALYEELKKL